jgi:LacI family transcriptional regulator
VIQKAMEMGYKQFAYASALIAAQREIAQPSPLLNADAPHEIALFSASFLGGSHFASLMLDSFQNQISQLGFTLSMHRVSDEHLKGLVLPLTFKQERVVAIICFEMFDRAYDEMLCQLGLPILFVDAPAKVGGHRLPADQLYMDNSSEICCLVNDMVAAGKRRIGFIGDYTHCQSFYERYSSFRLAMLSNEIPVEEHFVITENAKFEIREELARLDELPDLFLCANDFVALDALQALRSLGYDVPRDVWLAGFDDSGESRTCMPSLTTVHIHTQIMAYAAVELLRTRIQEPSLDFRTVHTETNLIYRDSTPLPSLS